MKFIRRILSQVSELFWIEHNQIYTSRVRQLLEKVSIEKIHSTNAKPKLFSKIYFGIFEGKIF
ncbi:hypothetical protein N692_04440 [Lactiplantibacillus plantarum EGD-AQ4]|nr:hypothetical protein N692_04440 [Lactiplantibacillus plantarum EGD-AQ4]